MRHSDYFTRTKVSVFIRVYFRYDLRLPGDLCRVAAGVIVESFRVLLAVPKAQPVLVLCVHTYNFLGRLVSLLLELSRRIFLRDMVKERHDKGPRREKMPKSQVP